MAPKPKISRDMILEAAFELVRAEGIESLTARSVSQRLGCSMQPVMYYFSTVEEIKQAVYEMADSYHSRFIMPRGEGGMNPLLELGMNYVRFGREEKQLFRLLFTSDRFSGKKPADLISAPEARELIDITALSAGISPDRARELFLSLFITAHGCASLLAGNAMDIDDEAISALLRNAFKNAL